MGTGIMRRVREGKPIVAEIREGARRYATDTGEKRLQCAVDPYQTSQRLPRRIVLEHGVIVQVHRRHIGRGQIWIGIAEE